MGLSAGGFPAGGGGLIRCVKQISVTKRSKIANSLPRIATSTANTLTAIKMPGTNILYLLFVCLLFASISEVLL